MDPRRLRFAAALTLFLAWVGTLTWLAIRSGQSPPPRAEPVARGASRGTSASNGNTPPNEPKVADPHPSR